ncbi:MAG: helix-turn-helix domain-containing protein [Patescibacteria group bacterium]
MVDTNATTDLLPLLGLTANELTLYEAFLKHGENSAAEVARKIGMDKSSAYRAVENLEKNRLVIRSLKTKSTTYSAVAPDVLKDVYTAHRSEMDAKKGSLDIFIGNLKNQSTHTERSTYIIVEKGLEAWQTRLSESLQSKKKLIREHFQSKHRFFEVKKHCAYVVDYAKKRAQKGIFIRQLEIGKWNSKYTRFEDVMTDQKKYNKEIRILPKDYPEDHNSIRIWDDTINIVSYDNEGEFITITIKDKFVVSLLETMYDFIWSRSSNT